MGNLHLKIIVIFSACLFIAALGEKAEAINLGTYVKADSLAASPGGYAKAEILFWSSANETYSVAMSAVKAPRGWYVVAVPQKFTVGNEGEYTLKENMLLPGTDASVAARVVDIVINVPEGEREGTYDVALEAVAGGGSGEVSLAQARIFNFRIYVKNAANKAAEGSSGSSGSNRIVEPDSAAAGLPGIAAENPKGQNAKGFGETELRMALLLLLSAAILYGAWRIYRHR